ncbi:MAG TPA: hypothetical protein VIX11_14515 [Candidatus Acidoferrum sp.]
MMALANHSLGSVRLRLSSWLRRAASVLLFSGVMVSGPAQAQINLGSISNDNLPSSVHGTVLNRITHEPIGRALVYSPDQRYAALTDDRGHFEFKFPAQESEPKGDLSAANNAGPSSAQQVHGLQNLIPTVFMARKPGFLQNMSDPSHRRANATQPEMTIYLDPEALIVGHVTLPGAEGNLRIRLELYRRDVSEGQERWNSAGTFMTWSDGEFRFCELQSGTYKLVSQEQLDRDPFTFNPGGPLFGYTPVFYPSAPDFSAALLIQLAAGATFQANLTPVRREYYSVKVPVGNAAAGQSMNIRVYPLGHPGPGYSLGYNFAEQMIEGMLPEGNYTLEADARGQPGSTGTLNFSVAGTASAGAPLNLIPNSSLTVNVTEEFKSAQSAVNQGAPRGNDGSLNTVAPRNLNVQVTLAPMEEFGSGEGGASQRLEGNPENTLVIPNVRPGRYRVRAESGAGYVASILCGGTDLMHEALVVGPGGVSSPIEVALRDDGAEVNGKAESASQYYVYFFPVGESFGKYRTMASNPDGSFTVEQLPPGTYLVIAFDSAQEYLAYTDQEALRNIESQGQILHLAAGQKEHLRLKVITRGEPQ